MQSSLDYVFYASLFLFRAGVTGRITNPPLNTVAEVGGQAIFNCTSDTTLQNWIFSTNREEYEASTGQNIVLNCVVQPGFTTHYEVDRPGGSNNKCNLIVKATTMQQAGVYTCTDATPGTSAILTVIDRDASITVSGQPETVEGETVTMSYALRYSTSTASSKTPTIKPVLTWTDSDGNTVTGSPSSTANSVTSRISVTAGRQDIHPYTCRISFDITWPSPSSGLSFATNTPNSSSNPPPTSTINVLYVPIISSITMSEEVAVCPGKTVVKFTCHATANPAPTFSWIGPDARTYSGSTIEAAMNGTYTCTASNVIRGTARSDSKGTTLNISWNASEKCTEENHRHTEVIIACSVIGAYIMGNIIATVVFLVYYNRNIEFKRNLNDRFTWLRKMIPCMNENVACGCGWIFLSVCVFTLVGLLFIIWMIVIAKCSRGRRRSEATAKHFHNPSSTLGPNGDDTYEQINDGRHRVSQDNSKKGKAQKKQQNGKENGKSKSADKKESNSTSSPRFAAPSSPPPNPHNEVPQHQQPTTAQGTVYSDLPVTDRNIQPQQYIEGNMDNNYSELNKT